MPRFEYTAADAKGRQSAGVIDAADEDALRAAVASRGLTLLSSLLIAEQQEESPFGNPPAWHDPGWRLPASVFGSGAISADEAAEAVGQLADLSKAGLPLAPGLRAMVAEMPRRWWRRNRLASVLEAIADQLDRGVPLEEAIRSQGPRFPPHVHGLLLAGVRSGRMAEALEEFAAIRRQQTELARRVRLILAYPMFLLVLVGALMLFFMGVVIPQFAEIFRDFGVQLPLMTQAVLSLGVVGHWFPANLLVPLVALVVLVWVGWRFVWGENLLLAIPVIGPMWQCHRLVEFSRWMALLLQQQMALPDALRLAGDGLRSVGLRRACPVAAERIEHGESPTAALAGLRPFPPTLRPLVRWGERTSSLAEAFETAAEMFEMRTRVQTVLVEAILPPLIFLFLGVSVAFVVLALFMPMISLIQRLS